MPFCAFLPSKFLTSFNIFSIKHYIYNSFLAIQTRLKPFARWRTHSFCCLFSLGRDLLCAFQPNFSFFSNVVSIKFAGLKVLQINSLGGGIIFCCLFTYCAHFCAFLLQLFAVFQLRLLDFYTKFIVFFQTLFRSFFGL